MGVLLLLVFSLLLAACGDATATALSTATPPTSAVTITTAAITVATTTATSTTSTTATATTTAPATAQAAVPTAPGSNTSPATAVGPTTLATYHPVISLSSPSVAVGGSLTVSGEGYPANTKLAIQLGPEGGPIATDSRATSDASGKFTSKVFFVTYPDGSVIQAGHCALAVSTEDGLVKTGAVVPVVEAPAVARFSPTKLIQDFFTAFKEDPKSAVSLLGSDLQTAIESGKTTLPEMLGVQNAPVSVEVRPVEGKPNTYDVYENFQAGQQYIQMDLASDANGNLKIVAIRIKKSSQ